MKLACVALVAGLAAVGSVRAQSHSGAPAGTEKARGESGEVLIKRSGCGECHARQTNLAAPAFLTISGKYQGKSDGATVIAATVKNGRHGRSVLTMPPHSNLSDAEAKKIADYILSLKTN